MPRFALDDNRHCVCPCYLDSQSRQVTQFPQTGRPILGVPSANDLAILDFVDVHGLNRHGSPCTACPVREVFFHSSSAMNLQIQARPGIILMGMIDIVVIGDAIEVARAHSADLAIYPAGSAGPSDADALLAKDGRRWRGIGGDHDGQSS